MGSGSQPAVSVSPAQPPSASLPPRHTSYPRLNRIGLRGHKIKVGMLSVCVRMKFSAYLRFEVTSSVLVLTHFTHTGWTRSTQLHCTAMSGGPEGGGEHLSQSQGPPRAMPRKEVLAIGSPGQGDSVGLQASGAVILWRKKKQPTTRHSGTSCVVWKSGESNKGKY